MGLGSTTKGAVKSKIVQLNDAFELNDAFGGPWVQKVEIKSQMAQLNEAFGGVGTGVQQGAIKSQIVVLNDGEEGLIPHSLESMYR